MTKRLEFVGEHWTGIAVDTSSGLDEIRTRRTVEVRNARKGTICNIDSINEYCQTAKHEYFASNSISRLEKALPMLFIRIEGQTEVDAMGLAALTLQNSEARCAHSSVATSRLQWVDALVRCMYVRFGLLRRSVTAA